LFDLIPEAGVSNLIHAFELIEVDGIAVWHDESVE